MTFEEVLADVEKNSDRKLTNKEALDILLMYEIGITQLPYPLNKTE
jgi:hypothetical protein